MRNYLIYFGLLMILSGCASTQYGSRPAGEGYEVMATKVSFDAKKGEVRYTLPEPALVRLRVGLSEGGPLLRNVMDWERREAGEHVEVWDKKDASGTITFGDRSDYMAALSCLPVDEKQWPRRSQLTRGLRQAPRFTITFPESGALDSQGIPVVRGNAPVRITVDAADGKWLAESKYEVAIFIDYTFLLEDEEGTNPFTYRFDTKHLNNGPHTITVNIVTLNGETGTQSARVVIDNDRS